MTSIHVAHGIALRDWSDCLDNARISVSAFKIASMDPRLVALSESLATMSSTRVQYGSDVDLVVFFQEGKSKIETLMDDLKYTLARIGNIQNFIARPTLSIYRLPVELLKIIIRYAAEEDYCTGSFLETYGPKPISRKLCASLMQVCRSWRTICIDTRYLWKTIDFTDTPMYDRSKLYLKRSSGSGLDVYLRSRSSYLREVSLVMPFISGWNHLSYSGNMALLQSVLDPQIQAAEFCHSLASLTLERFSAGEAPPDPAFMDRMWKSLRRLDGLDLSKIPPPFTLQSFSHLLRSLRYLRLFDVSFRRGQPGDIQTIFEYCRELVVVEFVSCDFSNGVTTSKAPMEPVIIPNLSTIVIKPTDFSVFNEVFTRISAPTLRHLWIDQFSRWFDEALIGFLERSNCDVERLDWEGGYRQLDDLPKLLSKLPSLRVLNFLFTLVNKQDLHCLTTGTGLQKLSFQNSQFVFGSLNILSRFVQSRNDVNYRTNSSDHLSLRKLVFERCSFEEAERANYGDWAYAQYCICQIVEDLTWNWDTTEYIQSRC
jgi:hypothetical protein